MRLDETVTKALLLSLAVLTGAPGVAHDTSARRAGRAFARALVRSTRSPGIRESEDIDAPLEGRVGGRAASAG